MNCRDEVHKGDERGKKGAKRTQGTKWTKGKKVAKRTKGTKMSKGKNRKRKMKKFTKFCENTAISFSNICGNISSAKNIAKIYRKKVLAPHSKERATFSIESTMRVV